jgi:predicted NAD-dependent protein-ADP-ribosyltransferase YbiA (DUF1768 family)
VEANGGPVTAGKFEGPAEDNDEVSSHGEGPVYFRLPAQKWGELSNFWPQDTPIPGPDGMRVPTAEHLYWVLAYTYEGMNANTRGLRSFILGASTPLKARYWALGVPKYIRDDKRRFGKDVQFIARQRRIFFPRDRETGELTEHAARPHPNWNDDMFKSMVMSNVVHAKFSTSERARTILLQTEGRPIHACLGRFEPKWGVGTLPGDRPPVHGKNLLGSLIEQWRDTYLKHLEASYVFSENTADTDTGTAALRHSH